MRSRWQSLGFKRQLVLIMTGTFLLAGAILLVGQYVVLRRILSGWLSVATPPSPPEAGAPSPDPGAHPGPPDASATPTTTTGPGSAPFDQAGPDPEILISPDPILAPILREVQLWSAVFLLVFAVFSLVGALLVTRGIAHRIGRIATETASITRDDLSRRLDTAGPDDEIKELSSAINTMIEGLEGAFRRQEAFIANAAHEFRTPLATTRTVLQVADRQGRIPPELAAEVEDVLTENARMNDLVSALLLLAQARSDADLPRAEVDLPRLVDEVVAAHRAEATKLEVSLTVELAADAPLVMGSESLLRSLIDNLVSNALNHNRRGGFAHLNLTRQDGAALLTVTNSGQSRLSPDAADRLPEPFHRGERSRLHNDDGPRAGVGLGLSLVETVASAHGGTLTLAPGEPDGLSVQVALPLHGADDA